MGWVTLNDDGNGLILQGKLNYENDRMDLRYIQKIDGIIDNNLASRNKRGKDWKGDLVHYASIPTILKEQWEREMGVQDCLGDDDVTAYTKKHYLNNSDYRDVRTNEGVA